MRREKFSLVVALIVVFSLLLTACGSTATSVPAATTAPAAAATTAPAATTAAAVPTNLAAPTVVAAPTAALAGSTLDRVVIVQGVDPSTLDPQDHSETPAANILNNIYEPLLSRSPDLQLVPKLAESWKQLDELTWEFKLRKGVKWHDGSDFTADDVKFTFDRYAQKDRKPKPIVRAANLAPIASTTVVDPLTVQVKMSAPFPVFINRLNDEMIVSKKYVTEKGEEYLAANPMGTGPYKFVEFKKANYTDMQINKDYWGPAPKAQSVRFRTIPDANTRIAALQAGEVDIITNVPPELIDTLQNDKVGISSTPSVRVAFLIVNTFEDGSPLQKTKVRQALNMAIDRDAIIKSIFKGNAVKATTLLTDKHFGYNSEITQYAYDPAKAKQLLAEAGYPNGIDITFNYPTGRYLKDKETAEIIASQWAEVGIRTKTSSPEWTQYVALGQNRKQAQVYFLAWGNATWDADGTYRDLLRKDPDGTYGTSTYWDNPTFLKDIYTAASITDSAKREALYKEAGQIMHDDASHVFLWQFKDIYGYNKAKIKFNARPDERLNAFEITSAK